MFINFYGDKFGDADDMFMNLYGGVDFWGELMNLEIDDSFMGRYCSSLAHAGVDNPNCVKYYAGLKTEAAARKKKDK